MKHDGYYSNYSNFFSYTNSHRWGAACASSFTLGVALVISSGLIRNDKVQLGLLLTGIFFISLSIFVFFAKKMYATCLGKNDSSEYSPIV